MKSTVFIVLMLAFACMPAVVMATPSGGNVVSLEEAFQRDIGRTSIPVVISLEDSAERRFCDCFEPGGKWTSGSSSLVTLPEISEEPEIPETPVLYPPEVTLYINTPTIRVGERIVITTIKSQNVDKLEYNYGDGAGFTTVNTHTYTRMGRFLITLKATNAAGSGQDSKYIRVIPRF